MEHQGMFVLMTDIGLPYHVPIGIFFTLEEAFDWMGKEFVFVQSLSRSDLWNCITVTGDKYYIIDGELQWTRLGGQQ